LRRFLRLDAYAEIQACIQLMTSATETAGFEFIDENGDGQQSEKPK
jgi:hypothetical protein